MARGIRVLASQGEQVEDSEAIVTSALGYPVWCSMPDVSSDGATTTAKYGDVFSFRATSTGPIEIRDHMGRRVAIVRPFSKLVLVARNNDSEALPSWEVFGPGYKKPGSSALPVHIADLAVTDSAIAGSTAALTAAYVEATAESEVNAGVDASLTLLEASAALSFGEVEEKVNRIIAQLDLAALSDDISIAEGTDTLALAATSATVVWQTVADSERLVTNARAHTVYCTLPDVSSDGATTTVPLKHSILFKNTGGGPIIVRDFDHKFVCVVPDETNVIIKAISATANTPKWAVIDEHGSELALATAIVNEVAPLNITMPLAGDCAVDLAAAYTDANWNAKVDTAIDAAVDTFDTAVAAAFAQVETTVNAILVAIETVTLTATS